MHACIQHFITVHTYTHDYNSQTGDEVGYDVNEDVEMDVWRHQAAQIMNERIRGTEKVGRVSKNVLESMIKLYVMRI